MQQEQACFRALIGLDGFVDEVVRVVDRRESCEAYTCIETIAQFGQRISQCAGMSSNIEMVTQTRKIGGNGAILANALCCFGVGITYIGTVGVHTHDEVFSELATSAELIGIAEPGKTDAIEFQDGKIISSKLDSLNALRWNDVKCALSPADLAARIDGADLVSFNNWTMIPQMSEIWRGILSEVMQLCQSDIQGKLMFIDLADPEKRSVEDIIGALALLEQFESRGFKVVLGLNKKEAHEILKAVGADLIAADETLESLVRSVASRVQISGVTVHPVDGAGALIDGVYEQVDGPYCPQPLITTGAGDHFNAGFVYGLLRALPFDQSLTLGVSTSGYYVRTGISPTLSTLIEFIKNA